MLGYKLLLAVMVQLTLCQTNALRHGFAPEWIARIYCNGEAGPVSVPWDCGGYLHCTARGSGVWIECHSRLMFDANKGVCVSTYPVSCLDGSTIANQTCGRYPKLKFPHPHSCAKYYDCSQTMNLPQFNLSMYENECDQPLLFDESIGDCRFDPKNPVSCFDRPIIYWQKTSTSTSTSAPTPPTMTPSPECAGKRDGPHRDPEVSVFSPKYITCSGGLKTSMKCAKGFVFDHLTSSCSSDYTDSVINYCRMNPQAIFPDSQHCGRYFNCSTKNGYFYPNPHKLECLYMYLFDPTRNECLLFNQSQPCGDREEPINPCDYRFGHCVGRNYCIQCTAKCEQKPDGNHPYPGLPNTRFYMVCNGGRTEYVLQCNQPRQIFSEKEKKCIYEVPPPPPPTTPPTTTVKTTTIATTTTKAPPVLPGDDTSNVCACMDRISPLDASLRNLSSFVDTMYSEMQVGNPYDCDAPPQLLNSIMKVSYEFDMAVARYTCVDGYSACGGQLTSSCTRDNIWDTSSLGECLQSTWTNLNSVMLPCDPAFYSAIQFRGRSVEDLFTFSLTDDTKSKFYLQVTVIPRVREVTVKTHSVTPDISMTGEVVWTIEVRGTAFLISVNNRHVMTAGNPATPLSLIDTLLISDGFHTDEVKYFPTGVQMSRATRKVPLDVNLALNKVTSASSVFESATSDRLVDGFSHVLWQEQSCWAASAMDSQPWWIVDLGKTFFVSHVVITSLSCKGPCGKSLKDFLIQIYKEDPSENLGGQPHLCYAYPKTFPPGHIERLDCGYDAVGQFVKIASNGVGSDQMAICEVEVYGGLETSAGWSPFSCPDPPIIDGASVQVSYTDLEGIATYTCDGTDVMCSGNQVIHCYNETGWDSSPGTCIKTVLDAGIGKGLPDFPICRLNLGSGFELWATPTADSSTLDIMDHVKTIVTLTLTLNDTSAPVTLKQKSASSSLNIYPPSNPFKKGKESHIMISALTDHLLIEVDGEIFYKFPADYTNVHRAVFIRSSKDFRIRKVKIYPEFVLDSMRERVEKNLALRADVESSKSFSNPEAYGVDGNPNQAWPTGSCWNADVGASKQWFQVDLGKKYFIRDVKIDLRNSGEDNNLALKKTTFGSPNYDSKSSQDNVVDGVHNDNRDSLSCYSSSASVDDPWWMVDLGKEYTISSVAIQPRGEPGYDRHHSDLSVIIYSTNPNLDASAQPTTCTQKTGVWGPFERVLCTRPIRGRFVMVKRIVGAKKAIMTLCEVQVFEALESKLHDFTITVHEENPETTKDNPGKLCIKHEGQFPKDKPTTLTCAEDVWGQYVRIEADDITDQYDMMTICEVEIYGDKAVKKEWVPTDCPFPPEQNNAYVSVAYTPDKAIARYQCFDGYAICDGENEITCTSKNGWDSHPKPCQPRTFSAYDPAGLESVRFCPLRLGEAIEMYVIPKMINSVLVLAANDENILHMKLEPGNVKVTTDLTTGEPPVLAGSISFEGNKESKVVITVLSEALHVDVDGKSVYIKVGKPYLINTVWSQDTAIGKLAILDAGVIKTEYVPLTENLAALKPTGASTNATEADLVVDGDLSMTGPSCWTSSLNDVDAWWMVGLGKLYYVSHVQITTRQDCGNTCNRRVHDFTIKMFHKGPFKDNGELCIKYDGVLPHATTTMLTCVEKVYGRVLRIDAPDRRNGDDLFTLCEVQVFGGIVMKSEEKRTGSGIYNIADDGPRNLALFRPTMSSSVYKNIALPMRAVDGIKHRRYDSGSCWHAGVADTNPWWQVELDNLYFISHVEISSRACGGACGTNARDFVIEVFSKKPDSQPINGQLCLQYNGVFPQDTTKKLKCTNKAIGQFVRISSYNRVISNSVFALCEVEVYGEAVAVEEISTMNIAVKRPATASSRHYPPEAAVDGDRNIDWLQGSCWASEDGDLAPWWMVELDDYHLVSEVELTSRSDCGIECNKQLRNFKIEVFSKRPEPKDKGDVCLTYSSLIPHSRTVKVKCVEKVLGRFIRLTAYDRNPTNDKLAICEFGVYGAKVVRTEWTPKSCPEPPLIPNGCADICYHDDHAVATYKCNTNFSMCTGNNVLHCNSKIGGWEGTPGTCVQTTLEVHHGHVTDLREFPICNLRLGEGIEMWVTPEVSGSILELLDGKGKPAVRLTITPDNPQVNVILSKAGMDIPRSDPFFTIKKESHVIFLYLTFGIRVKVDGKYVELLSPLPTPEEIVYVRSSDGLHIRMARPIERYMEGIIRVPDGRGAKLAEGKSVTSSSSRLPDQHNKVVDGDLSQIAGECWHPSAGDTDQWIMIDLGAYFFIRELVFYNREVDACTVCADRTRDFVIDVLLVENDAEFTRTCAEYKGVMPLDSIETVRCRDDVWGRYIRIHQGNVGLMTFCEIQVIGDEVIEKPWTPADCPLPRTLKDASAVVTYADSKAIATYTCDKDHTMCTGNNKLECTSKVGWEGTLGDCLWTTRDLDYGRGSSIGFLKICNPKLGEGMEFWVFSIEDDAEMWLRLGETSKALGIGIKQLQSGSRGLIIFEMEGLLSSNQNTIDKNLFAVEREARITVVFLTGHLLIHVDGEFVTAYPYNVAWPKIASVRASLNMNIRKVKPLPRYLNGVVRKPLDNNLALNKVTSASSINKMMISGNVVDGDINQLDSNICWQPNLAEKDQWVMIDLDDYYFVREVVLYGRGPAQCSGVCGEWTHDFAIDILPTDQVDSMTTRCAFYKGEFIGTAIAKIRCVDNAWGRYVRISNTNAKSDIDLMQFCEIQVYGDAVVSTTIAKIRCVDNAWGRYVRISNTNAKSDIDLMQFCEIQVYGDAVVSTREGSIGWPCQIDTDCSVTDSACANGHCVCNPGLVFSQTDNTCVSDCKNYGSTYTEYPGYYIYLNNMATYSNVTSQQCKDHCTKTTAFVCRSADRRHRDGRCDLTSQTLGTVPPTHAKASTNEGDISHFSRDCI